MRPHPRRRRRRSTAGVAPRPSSLAGRRHEPGEAAADVVGARHEGTQGRVVDDADGARVHAQPLELVEVHAEGVGEDRLDHVTVAHDRVDGVRAQALVPLTHGGHRPVLHVRHRLALGAGEDGGAGVGLHHLPHRLLGEGLQAPARPVAVAALAHPLVDVDGHLAVPLPEHEVGGLPGPLERGRHHGGQRNDGQPRGQLPRLLDPLSRRGRRPASSPRARRRRSPWCARGG